MSSGIFSLWSIRCQAVKLSVNTLHLLQQNQIKYEKLIRKPYDVVTWVDAF